MRSQLKPFTADLCQLERYKQKLASQIIAMRNENLTAQSDLDWECNPESEPKPPHTGT